MTRHKVPLATHDYRADPAPYPALKTEQGVFTTPPYSGEIKGVWRFKDEASARESAEAIWAKFQAYGRDNDFIGMDTARKFIQMGRTRSLRYALRPGGQKYVKGPDGTRRQMARTGEVHDEEKLRGANVYEGYLGRCWEDGVYLGMWERWRGGERWMADGAHGVKIERAEGDVGETQMKREEAGEVVSGGERRADAADSALEQDDKGQNDVLDVKAEIAEEEGYDRPRLRSITRSRTREASAHQASRPRGKRRRGS